MIGHDRIKRYIVSLGEYDSKRFKFTKIPPFVEEAFSQDEALHRACERHDIPVQRIERSCTDSSGYRYIRELNKQNE